MIVDGHDGRHNFFYHLGHIRNDRADIVRFTNTALHRLSPGFCRIVRLGSGCIALIFVFQNDPVALRDLHCFITDHCSCHGLYREHPGPCKDTEKKPQGKTDRRLL